MSYLFLSKSEVIVRKLHYEMQWLSPKNGRNNLDNENYYNEEDEEDENMMAPQ
jgi:hypothetical protein